MVIMLVVAIAFSIVMLGPWVFIKDAANVTESKKVLPFLIYLAGIWGAALLLFPGLFLMISVLANRLTGKSISNRRMVLRLAYFLIPVGIFAWIAFSLPAILVNYGYIVSVFSDPLGLGWDLFHTADSHFEAFFPQWIPVIQGFVLLVGLYLSLSRGYLALIRVVQIPALQRRAMILPSLLIPGVSNLLLKLFMG